jgi:catechol 2,3-dioxygenase-like lactoylglutathione lyase family enzyme
MTTTVLEAFGHSPFALTLFVQDLDASKNFYGNGIGLALMFEDEVSAVYRCGQTLINLLLDGEAADLIAPAKVSGTNSVKALYTLRCADIDEAAAQLETAGVRLLNGPIDRPWGVRTVSFQDPSGHTWELANHD